MAYTKGEGMTLKATFDHALIGMKTGQQGHFRVWCDEYDTVPDGTILQGQEKTVAATAAGSDSTELMLTMRDSFRNALAKSTEAVSGSVAGTDYGAAGEAVQSLTVAFDPEQSGSGDPSPDNIRPILTRSGLTLYHGADQAAEGYEYSYAFGQAIYGGTLNVATGVLTVDKTGLILTGTETNWGTAGSGSRTYYRLRVATSPAIATASASKCGCSHWPYGYVLSSNYTQGYRPYTSGSDNYSYLSFRPNISAYSDVNAFKAYVAAQYAAGTPVTCWWTRQSSAYTAIQLDPLTLRQLFGRNRIWTDAWDKATVSCTFSTHGLRITYDGTGSLQGEGGGVQAFDVTIDPADLVPLHDPNDPEHLEIAGVTASGTLTKITYSGSQEREHISIAAVTATGTLTDVHDL